MNIYRLSIAFLVVGLGPVSLTACTTDPGVTEIETIIEEAASDAGADQQLEKKSVDGGKGRGVDGAAESDGDPASDAAPADDGSAVDAATGDGGGATDGGAPRDGATNGGVFGVPCAVVGATCGTAFPICFATKDDAPFCTKLCTTDADCPATSDGCGRYKVCKLN